MTAPLASPRRASILSLTLILILSWIACSSTLSISSLSRHVSLETHVAREKIVLSLHNDEKQPLSELQLAVENMDNLASVQKQHGLSQVKTVSDSVLKLKLDTPISVGETKKVDLLLVYSNRLTPKPKRISQKDHQKVFFETSAIANLPYKVQTQTLVLSLPRATSVENYTPKVRDVSASKTSNRISYGPFHNVSPNSAEENDRVSVHFQNDYPFVRIEKLTRHLELSMWGNLAVEEKYVIRHAGAQLEGGFSRLDYTKGGKPGASSPASFNHIVATLPVHAHDIYYRDRIGNISTSTIRHTSNSIKLQVNPRYPMFGGWKSTFTIGYNVPISDFLKRSGSNYVFNYPFGTPFPEAPIDEYTLEILFPEGCSNIKFIVDPNARVPNDIEESMETFHTYLDTIGRPMLITHKKNVSPELSKDTFGLTFNFSRTFVLHEPMLVIGALFAVCVATMIYVRFDVKIAKTPSQIQKEQQSRAHELVEQFVALQVERDQLYTQLESAFSSMRRSDDASVFEDAHKQVVEERGKLADQISAIKHQLKSFQCTEVLEKITVIERKEEDKMSKISQLAQMQKRHISEKKKVDESEIEKVERQYDSCTDDITEALEALI